MDRAASRDPGASLRPIEPAPGGVRLRVHLQPRASRTEIVGRHGDEIRVRVAAPPVEGAANDALVRVLADVLRVPRSAVVLTMGVTGRRKTIVVAGVTAAQAEERLGLA